MELPPATAVFAALRDRLPTPRPFNLVDVHLGLLVVAVNIAALVPPPTRTVRLFRAALAPFVVAAWLWLGYVPILRTPQERWGTTVLLMNFVFRALETLIAFPPEFHCYRLRPTASGAIANPEPVPAGWTWAKAEWAASLWWSWRGIGWNYGPPLASSMREEPYTPTSTHRAYLLHRTLYLVAVYAVEDLASTYMRLVAPDFFVTATTPYASLTTAQRALHSIAVVSRIVCSIEFSHVGCSLLCVAAGGYFGVDGELFSPWGWPPIFGSIGSIWKHPGLAYMWNRAWNQYNRRMLHCWAWVGICEKILRLSASGEAVTNPRPKPKAADHDTSLAHRVLKRNAMGIEARKDGNSVAAAARMPPTPPADDSAAPIAATPLPLSPPDSGRNTPVPVPYQPDRRPRASLFTNLFKSFVVFTFSGLQHDWGSFVMMLDAVGRGEEVRWRSLLSLTPFFVAQPLALAVEAGAKQLWRWFKHARGWQAGPPSGFERLVGFVWTWVWLGWSARFFVEGMSGLKVWQHWPGKTYMSALWWVWGV